MERFLVHETAVHFLDVFAFLLGLPDQIYADLRRLNPNIAGEDAGLIILGYEDGRRAIFDGNRLIDHAAENRRLTMGEALVEATPPASGLMDMAAFTAADRQNRLAPDLVLRA